MLFSDHCWLPSKVTFEQNLKELRESSMQYVCGALSAPVLPKSMKTVAEMRSLKAVSATVVVVSLDPRFPVGQPGEVRLSSLTEG